MKTSLLNRTLLGIILLLTGLQLSASTFYNGTLTGTLLDAETQEPIPHANVVLLRSHDNAFIRSVATNADGSFRLSKVPFGHYKLATTVLGYREVRPIVSFNGLKTRVILGNVALEPALQSPKTRFATEPATNARPAPIQEAQASRVLARLN